MTSRIPAGMRYYIGAEARLRRTVEDVAMSVFEGWNYEEVITPSVDYYDLFEQGMGQREAQRGFRFTDNDGRLLALRPDVTSSVARMAATFLSERPRPLRFCYAAPVFRQQTQSHAEWRRENTQLGCELIGIGGKTADLEVLRLAAEILSRLNLQSRYCITINNVEIFNGVAAHLNLEERRARTIAPSDRHTRSRRVAAFPQKLRQRRSTRVFTTNSTDRQAQRHSKPHAARSPTRDQSRHWIHSKSSGPRSSRSVSRIHFEIDLGDVSSLDYYTGLSLKIFVHGAGSSVGRGGRYDGLTGSFGRAEPAVGFVLNLDALTEVLGRSGTQD